jgi:hypothetical protein
MSVAFRPYPSHQKYPRKSKSLCPGILLIFEIATLPLERMSAVGLSFALVANRNAIAGLQSKSQPRRARPSSLPTLTYVNPRLRTSAGR